VRSATYRVRQHYRYVYSGAVHDMKQRLVMIPPDRHGDQVLRSWTLDVRGIDGLCSIDWELDAFGNRVCHVQGERVDHAVDFEALFWVERGRKTSAPDAIDNQRAYLEFTALTAPNDAVRAAAHDIRAAAASSLEQAERAHDWTARSISYQVGVTGTRTPAAMALHLGGGVCQDFAHIMIALVRGLGIPCRYVSGYVHLDKRHEPSQSHAWIEFWAPSHGWIPFDPTHNRAVDERYVVVGHGRSYDDVPPNRGIYRGAAHETLRAEVETHVSTARPVPQLTTETRPIPLQTYRELATVRGGEVTSED
jgi:transglutaminase-like putative cysteine protease